MWRNLRTTAACTSLQMISHAVARTRTKEWSKPASWKTALLLDAGLPQESIGRVIDMATKWNIPLRRALSLYTKFNDALCYWTLARHLGIAYCGHAVPSQNRQSDQILNLAQQRAALAKQNWGQFVDHHSPEKFVCAPEFENLPSLYKLIKTEPTIREHIVLASPSTLRKAAILERQDTLAQTAISHLEITQPGHSASRVLSRPQTIIGLLILLGIPYFLIICPGLLRLVFSVCFAVFFALVVMLRVYAVFRTCLPPISEPPPLNDHQLPSYSVLVPLYQEANMLKGLIGNLEKLDYPSALLDIKIILEADDLKTIEAAQNLLPGAPFEIVIVPGQGPQTKPKALNYTLPLCRSELVCIYDAEDAPAPDQLRRAAAKLMSDPGIGAVQCALSIKNHGATWFTQLFALEYEALFGGFLPALESLGMPIPLGGTSNHFRKSVLEETGAWDAFNVAEDADLGIRLARYGYRSATLQSSTLEEAPLYFSQWLPQRTRWFKGWVQSWLVHMRAPQRLLMQLGSKNFVAMHLILAGMFLSAALHPLFAYLAVQDAALLMSGLETPDALRKTLIGLNLFNLIAGYGATMALCLAVKLRNGSSQPAMCILQLPIYWWLMSLAAWRSIWQLMFDPFRWEKTNHGLTDPN